MTHDPANDVSSQKARNKAGRIKAHPSEGIRKEVPEEVNPFAAELAGSSYNTRKEMKTNRFGGDPMESAPQSSPTIHYAAPTTLVPSKTRELADTALFVSAVILLLLGLITGGLGVLLIPLPDGGGLGLTMALAGACLFVAGVINFIGGRQVRRGRHDWTVALLIVNLSLAIAFVAILTWDLYWDITSHSFSPLATTLIAIPLLATAINSAALAGLCHKHTPG